MPRSFEELALPHLTAAYNLAYWLVRSRSDAEDVVQDAMVRAFRAFGSLKGEDARPWLLAIVRNVAYRALAQKQRAGNVVSLDDALAQSPVDDRPALQIASEEPSAEAMLVRASEHALVMQALAELAAPFREVIVLREIEEMSYRDIADVIGSPVGTVMSRLSRARAELKARLEQLTERQDRNAV